MIYDSSVDNSFDELKCPKNAHRKFPGFAFANSKTQRYCIYNKIKRLIDKLLNTTGFQPIDLPINHVLVVLL